jgi:HSP20 family protein
VGSGKRQFAVLLADPESQGGATMLMTRWNPNNEMRRMREDLDRMWRGHYPATEEGGEMEGWTIPLDVIEEGNNIVVHATVPGVKPEDIEVTLEENVLTIKGKTEAEPEHKEGEYLMRERRAGAFHRMLRLPDTVNTEKAETAYGDGVLTITFPKLEAKKAKHLKVTARKALK